MCLISKNYDQFFWSPFPFRSHSHYSRMDETSKSADSSQEKTILMKPRLLDDESGLLGHIRDMQQQQQLQQQQQALQQQLQQQQLQQQLQQQQTINDMQGMGLR